MFEKNDITVAKPTSNFFIDYRKNTHLKYSNEINTGIIFSKWKAMRKKSYFQSSKSGKIFLKTKPVLPAAIPVNTQ